MSIEQEYKQANISIDPVRYYLLWLKATLLKVLSLGLYAPWANQQLNDYLLSNTRLGAQAFNSLSSAQSVFKARLIFLASLLVATLLAQNLPALSEAIHVFVLLSLPGFYLIEKRSLLNAISLANHAVFFKLSLIEFYKTITLPVIIFLLATVVIVNSEIIDSQFLASIETKEISTIYAENSYLALAEQASQKELPDKSLHFDHESDDSPNHGGNHTANYAGEIEQWNENISQQEKDYLDAHEKSHNHGNIALSQLQKYQVANQGNQFMQYVLIFILLCILWPWIDYKMMAYRISNTNFLGGYWGMKLGVVSLYRLYMSIFMLILLVFAFIGLMLAIFLTASEGTSPEFWSNLLANSLWLFPLVGFVFIFAFSLLFIWRKEWMLSSLANNYVPTQSDSSSLATLLLAVTNTLAVFFSLGLALPWCHMRTKRYFINHFNMRL